MNSGPGMPCGQLAGQAHISGQVADAPVDGQHIALGVQPEEADRPAGGPQHVQHAADRRGLPGAVGAEKPKDLAALHLERDVAHGAHWRLASIGLDQVRDLNRHGRSPFRDHAHLLVAIQRRNRSDWPARPPACPASIIRAAFNHDHRPRLRHGDVAALVGVIYCPQGGMPCRSSSTAHVDPTAASRTSRATASIWMARSGPRASTTPRPRSSVAMRTSSRPRRWTRMGTGWGTGADGTGRNVLGRILMETPATLRGGASVGTPSAAIACRRLSCRADERARGTSPAKAASAAQEAHHGDRGHLRRLWPAHQWPGRQSPAGVQRGA